MNVNSGGSRWGSGGSLEPAPSPRLQLSHENEIIWSHENHRIFKKSEIKSEKRSPTPLYIWTPFTEILEPPL